MSKTQIINILSAFFILFFSACNNQPAPEATEVEPIAEPKPEIPVKLFYGFNLNEFSVEKNIIKRGDTFGKILLNNNISAKNIHNITQNSKKIFNPSELKIGDNYMLVFDKKKPDTLAYLIYEPSVNKYITFNLVDSLNAKETLRKVTFTEKTGGGIIQNNLIQDMIDAGIKFGVAHSFSQIFDYTIDFFQLQKGDKFKIIFEEKYVDDSIYAGVSKIKAAYFEHKNKPFYAFHFHKDGKNSRHSFYDENGNTMKKMFLKAPLDIFRITSKFGKRRHPILHKMKVHFGTDYAAPHGTPIRATANGTVIQTGYTSGNGNFVKIRHNRTYETQYLHMSKILVKKGAYVSQGDIIGKVGSTGLATGPHVCYRFWKNGVQVDPLNEVMPQADPIDPSLKADFLSLSTPLKQQLDSIILPIQKDLPNN